MLGDNFVQESRDGVSPPVPLGVIPPVPLGVILPVAAACYLPMTIWLTYILRVTSHVHLSYM